MLTMSLIEAWNSDGFVEQRRNHLEQRLQGTLCGNCWLGRRDPIAPLNSDYADIVDFPGLQSEATSEVAARLGRS